MSIDLNSLLSSELVLLLVGSLIIPAVFGFYAYMGRRIQDKRKKQLLTRIIIYRLDLIDDACSHFNFDEAVDVINGEDSYTPMMKENEDNINIFGLIMSALNDNELKKRQYPNQ